MSRAATPAKMYIRDSKPRKSVIRMDPDCAICQAPASMACDCEAKGLEQAIRQAEDRMMKNIYAEIRKWVRAHAQDYILEYFRLLAERRKAAHTAHMDHIHAHASYYYNAPPHPNQIADAEDALKRGIDEDWQASVQRYPEVLAYFFSLVELTLPADDEPSVKNPPLGSLNTQRKNPRRTVAPPAPPGVTAAIAPPSSYHERAALPPRTPPPMDRFERLNAAPPARRMSNSFRPVIPHAPPASFHAPYFN